MASEPVRRYAPSAGGSGEASGGGRRTRRPRGRGGVGGESGGGGSFDISSLLGGGGGNPLGALLSRYGDMMDANLAAQEAEIPRQAKAFDYYSRGQESELEDDEMRREMGRREATYGRQRELASGKEARNAKVVAREGTRAATHGQESRERSVQQRYDPFGSMYSSGNSLATTVSPWTRQAAGGKY